VSLDSWAPAIGPTPSSVSETGSSAIADGEPAASSEGWMSQCHSVAHYSLAEVAKMVHQQRLDYRSKEFGHH
jgi:hypothetical protein